MSIWYGIVDLAHTTHIINTSIIGLGWNSTWWLVSGWAERKNIIGILTARADKIYQTLPRYARHDIILPVAQYLSTNQENGVFSFLRTIALAGAEVGMWCLAQQGGLLWMGVRQRYAAGWLGTTCLRVTSIASNNSLTVGTLALQHPRFVNLLLDETLVNRIRDLHWWLFAWRICVSEVNWVKATLPRGGGGGSHVTHVV